MIKVSHEIPKQLFPFHNFINDFPYILLHLCHKEGKYYDKEYAEFYKDTVKQYDFCIADNGAFELGDSYDSSALFELGEEYKPSHLILPDCLHSSEVTKQRAKDYINKYGDKSTPKFIGVIQGKTVEELNEVYDYFVSIKEVDVIAIPFDCLSPEDCEKQWNGTVDYKFQRITYFDQLMKKYGGFLPKKVHLLGCATPNEFCHYSQFNLTTNINSLDTSAPIVYGWNNIKFTDRNTTDADKPKEKLAENLDIKLSKEQLNTIAHNVKQFRTNLFI